MGRSQPPAVSWADDSGGDQVSATTTPSPPPFAPPPSGGLKQRPQASAWGDDDDNDEQGDGGGGGGGSVTAASPSIPPPVRTSAWGDDSDDDGDVGASPSPAPTPSGLPKALGDKDGAVIGLTPTAWGSDDPDDFSSPSRHARPFRTATAVPPPRPSVSSPTTSWGNDGEGDVSLSRPFPVRTAVAAAPASMSPLAGNNSAPPLYCPAVQFAGGGGGGGGDHGGVIAPLSGPFAHQEAGSDDRLLSWADEDEESGGSFGGGSFGGGEHNLRRQDNLGRSNNGISPARTPTTPAAFAFDSAGRVPPQRRETLASTYAARQPPTPSTTAPSPWPNSPKGIFARETGALGGEGGCPSGLDSPTSPTHGGGGWGGRRFTHTHSPGMSPRLGPFHAPGGSPSSSSPLRPFNHGSRWHPRQDREDGNDGSGNDNENEPQKLTPLTAAPPGGGGGWLQRAKGLFGRQPRGNSVDGVAGNGEDSGGPTRKRNKKTGNKSGSGGKKGGNDGDEGSGVRAWTFWDNFRSAPGLIARLCVCVLAVCALWMTSLSLAGEKKRC